MNKARQKLKARKARSSLTVNPFVSEAQRRWMHANEPAMAKRWEAHTPKGKALPKRKSKKVTQNARRAKNPLRIDPTRTITLRRTFAAKLKKAFAVIKGQLYKLVVEEDAFGLGREASMGQVQPVTVANYNPDQQRDEQPPVSNYEGQPRDEKGQFSSGGHAELGMPYGKHTPEGADKLISLLKEAGTDFKKFGSVAQGKTSDNDIDLIEVQPTEEEQERAGREANEAEGRVWDRVARGELTQEQAIEQLYETGPEPREQLMERLGFKATKLMEWSGIAVTRYENKDTGHRIELWSPGDTEGNEMRSTDLTANEIGMWDEDAHPRDDRGRFSAGLSGIGSTIASGVKAAIDTGKAVAAGAKEAVGFGKLLTAVVGRTAFDKLPRPMQKAVTLLYKGVKAVEHGLEYPYKMSQALAKEVARERGLDDKQVARVGKILGVIDGVTRWTNWGPLHYVNHALEVAAGPGMLISKASYYVPIGSLAYIAGSTATNPFATIRAARTAVKGQLQTHSMGLVANMTTDDAHALVDAMEAHHWDDWYEALLYAAVDEHEGKGSLQQVIEMASTAYLNTPSEPVDNSFCPGEYRDPTCSPSTAKFKRDEVSGIYKAEYKGHKIEYENITRDAGVKRWLVRVNGEPVDAAKTREGAEHWARKAMEAIDEKPTQNRYQFRSSPAKIEAFQGWLKDQFKQQLIGKQQENLWKAYAEQGYRKGAGRAFDDTRKLKRPELYDEATQRSTKDFYAGTKDEFLRSSFAQPVSVEKVQLLAGRSFDDLENVTTDMSARMSRVLTDGLVEGKSPREVARDLDDELDLGKNRSLTIARTELIRAHAEGQLDGLKRLGIDKVGVMVEWSTTGDEKVCDECEPMEGTVLSIDEARGMIPMHPNCRCAWVPALEDDQEEEAEATENREARAWAKTYVANWIAHARSLAINGWVTLESGQHVYLSDDGGFYPSGPPKDTPPQEPKSEPKPAPLRDKFRDWIHAEVDNNAIKLSEEQKASYKNAATQVIGHMPDKAVQLMNRGIERAFFYPSIRGDNSTTEAWVKGGNKSPGLGKAIGGFYSGSSLEVHLDGRSGIGTGIDPGASTTGIYAHEFGHAIDMGIGMESRYGVMGRASESGAWHDVFKAEIDRPGGPLSEYARTNPSEGFAEFCRLLYGSNQSHRAREMFPRAHEFFRSRGLVREGG